MHKPISLISGLHGFVGKHLSDYLLSKGHKVAGLPRELLLDPLGLQAFLTKLKPDYIFHLATAGNIQGLHADDDIFVSNVFGTYNLLSAVKQLKIKGMVNVSSSSVAREPTMYSATKLSAEHLCEVMALKYNKPIVTARPYTLYGIGDSLNHLIPTIINSIKTGAEMDFVKSPVHDYVYVTDFVSALLLLAEKADNIKGKSIDVGLGEQYTNQEILTILEGISGKQANINLVKSLRSYDSLDWKANTTEIEKLGWEPVIGLPEGLKISYDYNE